MSQLIRNIEKLETCLARLTTGSVLNQMAGQPCSAFSGRTFENHSPIDESPIGPVARSGAEDIDKSPRPHFNVF